MIKQNRTRRKSRQTRQYTAIQRLEGGSFLLNTCSENALPWQECVPKVFDLPVSSAMLTGRVIVHLRDFSGTRVILDRAFVAAKLKHQFLIPLCGVSWDDAKTLLAEAFLGFDQNKGDK